MGRKNGRLVCAYTHQASIMELATLINSAVVT